MFSIEHCRKILGKDADGLTDQELEQIRNDLYDLGEMALDQYFKTRLNLVSKGTGDQRKRMRYF